MVSDKMVQQILVNRLTEDKSCCRICRLRLYKNDECSNQQKSFQPACSGSYIGKMWTLFYSIFRNATETRGSAEQIL